MPLLPSPGDQFGRYRIDSQLGFGGMGVVYTATDTDLGRKVALKVVSAALGEQEFLERFRREAEVLAKLNSPHVIAIYDVGEHDGAPFIVTQHIGGGDLGALMRRRGPMPPQLAALVCAEVAEALSDAHRAGVVHRDIKPSNVLLRDPDSTRDPMVYLCDFGIAHTETDGFARGGTVSGTWSYLSPECGRGEPGTPAADIYATGCLLWAALTGRPPYAGTDVEIAVAHQTAPIPQLAGDDPFSATANAILLRAMAKDPQARYPSADQLRDDLMTLRRQPAPPAGIVPAGGAPLAAGPAPTGQTPLSGLPVPPPTAARRGAVVATPPTPLTPRVPGRSRAQSLLLAGAVGVGAIVVGGGAALGVTRPWSHDDGASAAAAGGSGSGAKAAAAPKGPILGDGNGDGKGDVVAYPYVDDDFAKTSTYDVTTWTSDGTKLTGADERIKGKFNLSVWRFTGDFDGDGKGDTLTIRHDYGKKKPFPVTSSTGALSGDLTYPAAEWTHKTSSALRWYALDFDGDGRTDIVQEYLDVDAKTNGNTFKGVMRLWVHHNNGSGFDKPIKALQVEDDHFEKTAVGDVNGDGRADYLDLDRAPSKQNAYHTRGVSKVNTWIQQDDGTFVQQQPVDVRHQYVDGLGIADVDADGQNELVLVFSDLVNQRLRVSEFKDGVLQAPQLFGTLSQPSTFSDVLHPIFLSDVNGDGRADLGTFTKDEQSDDYTISVALAGDGVFLNAQTWATWSGGPAALHTYQLNGVLP
ncbi:protein kinase [Nocardioides sp. DS6]|uniref:non-specific serine/threonine protein kinase n=1 Tax=Nocardioides eburneus TaxID=3231482 RepID=A0ABV3SWF2_9ACTN